MEIIPAPLKGKLEEMTDGSSENDVVVKWAKASDMKAGILFYVDQVGKWVNDKGELKSCDMLELIKLSFPDLISEGDLPCEDKEPRPPFDKAGLTEEELAKMPRVTYAEVNPMQWMNLLQRLDNIDNRLHDQIEQQKAVMLISTQTNKHLEGLHDSIKEIGQLLQNRLPMQ